jgi:hypothetical protein
MHALPEVGVALRQQHFAQFADIVAVAHGLQPTSYTATNAESAAMHLA